MLKNRYLAAFALAGIIGFGACAGDEENTEFETDTAPLEETTPAPEITPTPVTVDSMGAMPADSAAAATTDSVTM